MTRFEVASLRANDTTRSSLAACDVVQTPVHSAFRAAPLWCPHAPASRLPANTTAEGTPARMDFHISAQQREMVASVRELAQSEFKPAAAALDGRHVPLGEHAQARRTRRAGHVGAGGIRRPRPAHPRHRADPGGDRESLLRHRDGHARRGRRADPRHRPLRPAVDPRPHSPPRGQRRLHAGDLHDRAACRHRRRQLSHQCAHRRRPRHPERHQDADQPRPRGRHVHRLHPRRRQAGPRGHRLRPAGTRHQGLRGHRHLPHHGRREPARDPVQRLRTPLGKPGDPARTASASCCPPSTRSAA